MQDLAGKTLSHYQILERIGAGGMGVVYRARDERLERDVAIKVLPEGALAEESARKQFRKEALALSRLNHANIATVYDFDTQGGVDFLAMELVEGETLSDHIARAALSEGDVRQLGVQLAEGLAAAHRRGVLHRDIKPGNLRLTHDGTLKILDFGLAKVWRPAGELATTDTMSATGTVAGTIPYMSPEQVRGDPLDFRSDLYGAGTVLYEMATGRRAFPQESAGSAIGAILSHAPPRARDINTTISLGLEEIILRCLEKDPAQRYQVASELASDLRSAQAPPSRPQLRPRRARNRRVTVAGIAGAAVLAAAVLLWSFNPGGIRDRVVGGGWGSRSLAVLPFTNLSADSTQGYFADGMTDELITRLAQVSSLKVISRTSAMQYKGTKKSLADISRELGVQMIVEGSVRRDGERVRVNAELIRAGSAQPLWAESFERGLSDVLVLQSELARAIVEKVRVHVLSSERSRLATSRIVKPEAHESFLKAETELHLGTADKARDLYRQALVTDPGYAEAYAGLAYSYCMLSSSYLPPREVMPKAESAALMAVDLDSTLGRAHGALGYVTAFYDWNWRAAEHEFKRALELNPGSAELHQDYAYLQLVNGRFEESSEAFSRARELDPLSSWIAFMSIWPVYNGRRYDEAIREAQALIRSDPSNAGAYHIIGQASLMKGDYTAAVRAYDRLAEAHLPYALLKCWRVNAYARAGQRGRALALLDTLLQTQRAGYVPAYGLAIAYAGLGEKDLAFQWLGRGIDDRSEDMVLLKVEPAWDVLRSDPRFAPLLRRVGFRI